MSCLGSLVRSGRGADEELYFLIFISCLSSLGEGRPDAVTERLRSAGENLCRKFVSKLTVTLRRKIFQDHLVAFGWSISASWRCTDIILVTRAGFFSILLLSTCYHGVSVHARDHL